MICVRSGNRRWAQRLAPVVLAAVAATMTLVPAAGAGQNAELPETSFDGLTLVKRDANSFLYAKTDVDLARYDQIRILGCQVAFRKDWARDFNRSRGSSVSRTRVTEKDMEKIKAAVAELFDQVFTAELAKSSRFAIVSEPTATTLLVRPAIINLDVHAPDLDPAVRTKVQSAGEGTLYLELYDAVSGEILARAVDRRADPERPFHRWATAAFNRAAAERIMKGWAVQLREALERSCGSATTAAADAPPG
jgi:hypothetical protein